MFKASNYLVFVALFITLEIYRIPIMGYNIAFYHLFLALSLLAGLLTLFAKGRLKIRQGIGTALVILIIFGGYSFIEFVRNLNTMRQEVKGLFLAEIIGYSMALIVPLFVNKPRTLQRMVTAFLASAVFVYLGSIWHVVVFLTQKEFITGVPFWHVFSTSEHVNEYLAEPATFAGFPRFRLPFSSPAGTGLFLSLTGIILLALVLYRISNQRRIPWGLMLINLINIFCLLGTFARASWAIFGVGSLITLWYFHKFKFFSLRRGILTVLVMGGFLLITISLIPASSQFVRAFILRFIPEYTKISDIGHLESRILALRYWTERPVVGLGVGGFWEKPGGGIHTHSTYFTILVERGIIGLFLYFLFLMQLYQLVRKTMRMAKKFNDTMVVVYGIAFLSSLSGLFLGHLLYQMDTELIWLYYGIVLAYANLNPLRGSGDRDGEARLVVDIRRGIGLKERRYCRES